MFTSKEIVCISMKIEEELEFLNRMSDISSDVKDIVNQLNRKEFLTQILRKLDVMYEEAYKLPYHKEEK